jgi:hypothetical protein
MKTNTIIIIAIIVIALAALLYYERSNFKRAPLNGVLTGQRDDWEKCHLSCLQGYEDRTIPFCNVFEDPVKQIECRKTLSNLPMGKYESNNQDSIYHTSADNICSDMCSRVERFSTGALKRNENCKQCFNKCNQSYASKAMPYCSAFIEDPAKQAECREKLMDIYRYDISDRCDQDCRGCG